MAPWVRIANVGNYVDQEITIKGWVINRTDKGKLKFLQIRDGSGVIQSVVFKKEVDPQAWDAAEQITQETSLVLTGVPRADERAPGGYELGVKSLEVIQYAAPDYPIQPKEHGVGFLMQHRHLWLRSQRQRALLAIRATIVKAIRDWLDENGFVNVDTPILTPSAAEGTTTLFGLDYFDDKAYLTQSGQLYNEANIFAFGRVYCFGPTFRAEKSKTRRHLTEFWMVEPEMAFATLEDVMDVEEQMVTYIVQTVLAKHRYELTEILERDISVLEKIAPPFPRISYDDALNMIAQIRAETSDPEQKELLALEWGSDLGSPHETELSKRFDKPVFVYHYPTQCKAFYMEPVPGRPEVCRSVDLLAPEGYGEIIGGGQRASSVEFLEERIKEHRLPREAYEWYLDLRRYGSVPHAGFGLGVERALAWIAKLDHVRETIPYPRMLDKLYP